MTHPPSCLTSVCTLLRRILPLLFPLALLPGPAALLGQALPATEHTSSAFASQPPNRHNLLAATDAYLAGVKLLRTEDLPAAEEHFRTAVRLNPADPNYAAALSLAHEHRIFDLVQQASKARLAGQTASANALIAEAAVLDPENALVTQHLDQAAPISPTEDLLRPRIASVASIASPVELSYSRAPLSLHLRGDIQTVVRQAAAQYGLRAVFDDSAGHANVRFDLEDVPYERAMPLLLRMGHLFLVPLDPTSFLVAKDVPENRQRLERLVQETIYLPGFTPEQMTEIGNVVRNVFDLKQAIVEQNLSSLIVRAPEETLRALNLTLADLIDGGSAVMLELKLYSVDTTRGRNIGASLPQQFGAYSIAAQAQSVVSANQSTINQAIAQGAIALTGNTSHDLLTEFLFLYAAGLANIPQVTGLLGAVGGGLTSLGVYEGSGATINLALNSSEARALDDVQLRINDRQVGTFRVGSRYPIITATYSSGLSAAQTSALAGVSVNGVSAASLAAQYLGTSAALSIPQIQYEDLGVTFKATPLVQKGGNVSMHLELKIEALAGSSANNIPVLASRQFVSDVTVPDGQSALLYSNLNQSESRAVNGVPGLSDLPGFRQSLSDNITELDTSQLVILVTPHVVRRRSSAALGPRVPVTLPANSLD